MKIQCDVCEKAPATVICCADEAALCAECDVQVHAANKLASKHQRLLLQCLSNKLPRCDICQDKTAFIFCVEDRALFCHGCDESIHVEGTLSGKHQRLLATGISVAQGSSCNSKAPVQNFSGPSSRQMQPPPLDPKSAAMVQQEPSPFLPSTWLSVDDFLQLSDYESGDKRGSPQLEWLADIGLFPEESTLPAAEVPELSIPPARTANLCKSNTISKRPRLEDNDEFFIVPDLG